LLRFLRASAQEYNDDSLTLNELDSVSWAVRDPHFADAPANGLNVTGVSETKAINPYRNSGHDGAVLQLA
jgi:hypothetical protein